LSFYHTPAALRRGAKGHVAMIIDDTRLEGGGSDDGRVRLALMAGALAFAAIFGALYAEVQALVS